MYTEAKAKKLCRVLAAIDAEQQAAKYDAKAHKERIDELLEDAKTIRIELESNQVGLFPLEEVPAGPTMTALAADPPAELEPEDPELVVEEMSDEDVLAACIKVGIEPGERSIDELRKLLREYLETLPPGDMDPNAPGSEPVVDEGILEEPLEPSGLTEEQLDARGAVGNDTMQDAVAVDLSPTEKAETTPGIDPYELGAQAREAGKPANDNPFEEGSYHGVSWANGWNEFDELVSEEGDGSATEVPA